MRDASERALILAPAGRDAALAAAILAEARIEASTCKDLPSLVGDLDDGGGFAVVSEEALRGGDLGPLSDWLRSQPGWSDFPFILLTFRGGGLERNPAAARYIDVLGNVTFLERPFHPTTLVSLARAALRGRRRQYEARKRIVAIRESEARLRIASEGARIGIWDWDLATGELRWDGQTRALFGLPPDAPVSYDVFLAGLHPADRHAAHSAVQHALEPTGNGEYDIEYRTIGLTDGTTRWVHAKGQCHFEKGEARRFIGTIIDITARKQAEEALREKTALLDAITESTPDHIFAKDRDCRMLLANRATLDIIGKPAAYVLGRNEAEWHSDPEQAAAIMANDRRIMEAGTSETIDEIFTTSAGELRLFASTKSPLRDAEGHINGIVGVSRDVTQLKQAEEKLRVSEEKYRNLFENMAEEVHFWRLVRDEAGDIMTWRLVDANPPALKSWGRQSVHEIVGKTSDEIFGPGSADHYLPIVKKIFASGTPHSFEDYFPHLERYFRFTTVPFGEFFITTGADITAIKQAERALRESEDRLRAFMSATTDVVYRMSPDWTQIRQLHGRDFIDSLKHPSDTWLDKYIPRDEQSRVQHVIERAIETKSVFDLEHRVKRADGSTGWTHSRAIPLLDAEGGIIEWFGAASDITQRKQHDEQVEMLMREVNHRAKNMLSLIQAIAHLTASTGSEDFLRRFAERIQSLSAAQDLLIEHEWKSVPLGDLVRLQLSHFADLFGSRISVSGPAVSISQATSQAISMAFHELATNATKYGALSNESGQIAIAWDIERNGTEEPTFVLSWVERGGPPVSKPQRRGFGSKVTTSMVERSTGGTVFVDYAPTGLVWRFECSMSNIIDSRVPISASVQASPQSQDRGALPQFNGASSFSAVKGRRVLVVEDEPLIAAEISEILTTAGLDVVGPASGVKTALDLLKHVGCDTAVLDVNLGTETSEPVARELMRSRTPFIVVSSYSREQLPLFLRSVPLIHKPLQAAALHAEIKRCLVNVAATS